MKYLERFYLFSCATNDHFSGGYRCGSPDSFAKDGFVQEGILFIEQIKVFLEIPIFFNFTGYLYQYLPDWFILLE